MNNPTPCEECDHVHTATRTKSPRQWMCMKFPRIEGLNSIAPTTWTAHEPYNRCVNINLGYCPLFERRRNGQQDDKATPQSQNKEQTNG